MRKAAGNLHCPRDCCNLQVSGMNFPSSLSRRSVVLSLVLEEVTDDDDEGDVIDGDENDVADDDHDGLVVSALRRQETLGESEQQGWRNNLWKSESWDQVTGRKFQDDCY